MLNWPLHTPRKLTSLEVWTAIRARRTTDFPPDCADLAPPAPAKLRVLPRLRSLYARYEARHLALSVRDIQLPNGLGRIQRISLGSGRVQVRGQSCAQKITFCMGALSRTVTPKPTDFDQDPTFCIDLPWSNARAQIDVDGTVLPLPTFPAARVLAARLALLPGFLMASLRSAPAVLQWFVHHDPRAIATVKRRFGLDRADAALRIDERWLGDPVAQRSVAESLTLILPVFNGHDLLAECLDRVLRHTDLPWHLVLINDASTDPRVAPWLRDWAAKGRIAGHRVTFLENTENLGFIKSVNRGLAVALAEPGADPVVLLNSDAFVPSGWASRLIAPLIQDETIASVTPMSNDAELLTVPVLCAPQAMRAGEADALDRIARTMGGALPPPQMPTAVGFCTALSRRYLDRVPTFDVVFGKGYGEEVDWSQKVAALGGRHVAVAGLFVEHRGGASFGSAEKKRLLRQNGALVSARHPGFDVSVQTFIAADPLVTPRLVLALGWAAVRAGSAPVPVYLGHALGGGADHDLLQRIAHHLGPAGPGAAVVLRVGGEFRWQVEVHSPAGVTRGGTDNTTLVMRLMALLPRRHVVYSCGVGDTDPVALPDLLVRLGQGAGHRLTVLFHDYLPISPSYTLLSSNNVYREVPYLDEADPAHQARRPDGRWVSLAQWKNAWTPVIEAAEIVVFSASSRDIVAAAWPQVAHRIVLRPHVINAALGPGWAESRQPARRVIGVLGNVNAQKGAAVLVDLSHHLARDHRSDLVVIGNIDPRFTLHRRTRIHGSYDLADLPDLVRRYRITDWFMPAIWPETFSFVTHEAIASGLPVWCFGLGAQADAVKASLQSGGLGGVIPLGPGPTNPQIILDRIIGAAHGSHA